MRTPAKSIGSFLFAIFGASLTVSSSGADVRAAAAETPNTVLTLRLGGAGKLPPLTTAALQKEVESIWDQSHVRLRWLVPKGEAAPTPTLTILMAPKTVASYHGDGPAWTVGELIRFDPAGAIAIASITGAARIIDENRRFGLLDAPAFYDHRLGVVLGRAVAHEIGHYVLRTNTHAQYGLMRARVDSREFADLRGDAFRLDRAADAYLGELASRGALFASAREAFSYSTR